MAQTEVPQNFIDEIKRQGLVDDRNVMFMVGSMKPRTSLNWADRVFAIKNDIVNIIEAKKGMFGQKVNKVDSFLISEIAKAEPFSIGSQQRYSIVLKNSKWDFDITNGNIPIVDKFLETLGIKK